jgi:peptidoglycan/LPS O-acetylase OafA/YrhL
MGILRFVLAAAVICGHSSRILGIPLIDSSLAVRAFFLISGFYMTLILDTKYERKRHSLWLFYSNRFLRIYPMYYATLLFCLGIYAAAAVATGKPIDRLQLWMQAAHAGPSLLVGLIALAQVTIVGIESVSLVNFSPTTGFAWVGAAASPDLVPGWRFCFLPQAWTIGVELLFYAVVPFIIHWPKRWLAALAAADFIVVALLRHFWTTPMADVVLSHGFPFELGYFLLGILAYRLFYKREIPGLFSRSFNRAVIVSIAVTSFVFGFWTRDLAVAVTAPVYVALVFLGVCFLFHQTKTSAIDRYIGELSYPMYLCHVPLGWVITAAAGISHRGSSFHVPGAILLPAAIVFSILMLVCIDYPVDRWRQQRVTNHRATPLPHSGTS